jgi:E3 ubiquitin-protein ligase RNF34
VKQLKEILMLNRVDFKGCCEKQELKERVGRLWQDHLAAPREFDDKDFNANANRQH